MALRKQESAKRTVWDTTQSVNSYNRLLDFKICDGGFPKEKKNCQFFILRELSAETS